jgi:hypothetical protein
MTASWVLFVSTAGMWIRAQWAGDALRYSWIGRRDGAAAFRFVELGAYRGSLVLSKADYVIVPEEAAGLRALAAESPATFGINLRQTNVWSYTRMAWYPGDSLHGWAGWGFAWQWAANRPLPGNSRAIGLGGRTLGVDLNAQTDLAIPWWSLALLFGVVPARAYRRWRSTTRRPPHVCVTCGYDLRATADPAGPRLATCPECGRAVATTEPLSADTT